MKLLKTLRNHWKKTVFGVCSLSYGTYYLIERKHNGDLFQAYCYEALKYGREKVHPESRIRRVTVFLNPKANKESGHFDYNKHVAPLLNLSGLDVRLVRLDRNTEANEYMKQLDVNDTDCIVIAGGNATLNECVHGLMTRQDSSEILKRIPIGVVPIGASNSFAKKWFMKLGLDKTNENELRLLADSAMTIIKGKTAPVDLIKVTVTHTPTSVKLEKADEENLEKGTAYKLLKEDKYFALSNVSTGFVTDTDAYLNSYKYFWKLKSRMNRYFMARYLRRQPLNYKLDYKLKCTGCSNCLNEADLKVKLSNLIQRKDALQATKKTSDEPSSGSFLTMFFRKFFKVGKFTLKETPEQEEKRLQERKKLESLIEKSKETNDKCGKVFETNIIQTELIANINEPPIDSSKPEGINTVFVKDPEFNAKKMFLAEKKLLSEFDLKKMNLNEKNIRFKDLEDNIDNVMCVEIDGEIFKLNNLPESNLKLRVEHMEKCFNMLAYDPELTNIKPNPEAKYICLKRTTLKHNKILCRLLDRSKSCTTTIGINNLLIFDSIFFIL